MVTLKMPIDSQEYFLSFIMCNLKHELLSFPGYTMETEINSSKSRVAAYINTRIQYLRRADLEGQDSGMIIIDLIGQRDLRIITRKFRNSYPQT